MSTESIPQAIRDYYAATRSMDGDAWVATFAPDAVNYDPVGGPPQSGREAIRQFFAGITDVFETVGVTEDFAHAVGNEVVVKWTGHGVGKNGREVMFEGIDLFELNAEGLIQTVRSYWDTAALMAQLQD
ncbi:MAG TPA: ketosteroid isomerase [Cyanobacteria bacterium UBA9273]|nr:ketosteroid isomerase [Cyanobacteria bacterium UBA9273]